MTSTGFLIDTHVLLWYFAADRRLSPEHVNVIRGTGRRVVSVLSIWEIAIKATSGKLAMPPDLSRTINNSDIEILPIQPQHVLHTATLPRHHNDPFDRLLIAQAQLEELTILTADRAIARYDVPVL